MEVLASNGGQATIEWHYHLIKKKDQYLLQKQKNAPLCKAIKIPLSKEKTEKLISIRQKDGVSAFEEECDRISYNYSLKKAI